MRSERMDVKGSEDVGMIIKKTIEKILQEHNVKPLKIILFGSRARGDHGKDSDWDCFVIIDKNLTRSEKRKITAEIRMELARMSIPNDVIIKSVSDFEREKRCWMFELLCP